MRRSVEEGKWSESKDRGREVVREERLRKEIVGTERSKKGNGERRKVKEGK